VPRPAAEVDRQVQLVAGDPGELGQERTAGRLEHVGQQRQTPRRQRRITKGVSAHGDIALLTIETPPSIFEQGFASVATSG
jgi:hypothetical protein